MAQRGMICTRCYVDTGCSPDTSGLSPAHVVALCAGWMCNDCLDEVEAIQRMEENPDE